MDEMAISLIFNFRFVVISDEEGFSDDEQMSDANASVVRAKLLKDKTNEILIGDDENRNDDELMEEEQDVDEETESEENIHGAVASDTSDESEDGSNVSARFLSYLRPQVFSKQTSSFCPSQVTLFRLHTCSLHVVHSAKFNLLNRL